LPAATSLLQDQASDPQPFQPEADSTA